jgi:hypothetical protein
MIDQMATDRELRTEVLRFLYENRIESGFIRFPTGELNQIDPRQLDMLCRHLGEHGLIEWHGFISGGGQARITAYGVDVIEGAENPPIAMQVFVGESSHVHNTASGPNARIAGP